MVTFGERHGPIGGRRLPALALCVLTVALASCGESDDRNADRPPVPINISVQIGASKVSASPAKFGAGPITMLVANQSGASQTITIDGPQLRQSVGPINPEDTATLKVTVQPGDYTVATADAGALRPARLTVGPKRPSAQNTLLLP
jgi:hypothetical protein